MHLCRSMHLFCVVSCGKFPVQHKYRTYLHLCL
jgi:hypothetical protein